MDRRLAIPPYFISIDPILNLMLDIPLTFKNTHFQHAFFQEGRCCRRLKEMTLPTPLRLAPRENLPTRNGHS